MSGQTVGMRVEVEVALAGSTEGDGIAPDLPVPTLRFRWLDGEAVTCGSVGGDGWTDISPASASTDEKEDEKEEDKDGGDDDAEPAAEPAADADADADAAPPTRVFSWSKQWDGVNWDDAFARQVNDRPFMYVFVGRDGVEEDADAGRPAVAASQYVGHVAIDTSALLDGDTAVGVALGDVDVSSAVANVAGAAPDGVVSLKVTVTADKPVLTEELRQTLNPLAISLDKVAGLPGITLPEGVDPAERRHITPTPYSLLERYCSPVFACYSLFDGDGAPRVVRTTPVPQGPDAKWKQKSVFLLGTMTGTEVREHFVSKPLVVEVHDRVRVGGAGRPTFPAADAARWDAMIGQPPPAPPSSTVVDPDDDGAGDGDGDGDAGGDGDGAGAADAPPGDPLDVAGVDEYAIRDIESWLRRAGDDNAHGEAVVSLAPLLGRSNERLAMIEQTEAHHQSVAASRGAATRASKADRKRRQYEARVKALKKLGIGGDAAGAPPGDDGADGGDGGGDGDGAGAGSVAPDGSVAAGSLASPSKSSIGGEPVGDADAADGEGDAAATPKFKPTWVPGTGHAPIQQTATVDVAPRKRRVVPKTVDDAELDLTDGERMVSVPSSFLLTDGRLRASISLARPLHDVAPEDAPPALPFTRAVLVMQYQSDAMLKAALSVIEEINMAALPEAPSTRSYQFSDEDVAAANDGTLDVITGFQVVDANWRVLVLEGLVDGGMRRLRDKVARSFPNSDKVRYLANPEVQFHERLFTAFSAAPKDIRLRDPLTVLMKQPGLYDRKRVSQLCFDGLYRLTEVRRATRLLHLKQLLLFPSVTSLLDIENKYGDTVTLVDMYGRSASKRRGSNVGSGSVAAGSSVTGGESSVMGGGGDGDGGGGGGGGGGVDFEASIGASTVDGGGHGGRKSRHPPMETANPEFLASLKARETAPTKDFVKGYVAEVAAKSRPLPPRGPPTDMEGVDLPNGGQVFVYSGQKLQYTELQKENMRKRLAKDKKATYTYSQEYQSLTVCLVNEAEIEIDAKAESQARWVTKDGFKYPAPKDPIEFIKHPKDVSAARKADLAAPWDDAHDQPPEHLLSRDTRKKFDTVPVRDMEFGYVDATGTPNPDFFQSVHLAGSGAAAEAAAVKKAEEDLWRSKVVVDSTQFVPHFSPKKVTQMNKIEGMLKGPVLSKSLRIIRNAKLPSGKRTSKAMDPPMSMAVSEPYSPPSDLRLGKSDDPALFTGTDAATGRKIPFITTVNPARLKPKSQSLRYTRKIPPMSAAEKTGPKWGQ